MTQPESVTGSSPLATTPAKKLPAGRQPKRERDSRKPAELVQLAFQLRSEDSGRPLSAYFDKHFPTA